MTKNTKKFSKMREKLERSMAPAMLCKKIPEGITKVCAKSEIASDKTTKTVCECTVESHESTRQGVKSSQPKNHEDHTASKGFTSMTHCNLVHNFIPMCQATPAWSLEKSQEQKGGYSGSTERQKRVHFATLMDICHVKNVELEPKIQIFKGRVVLRGDIVKDDSGAQAVFSERGSSASQMTAARVMDVVCKITRL